MAAVRKILFPVDLSESSPKIVPWVKEMADKYEAGVHLLFVVRAMEHYVTIGVSASYILDLESAVVVEAEKSLKAFRETHFGDTPIEAAVVNGYPPEEILNYAERNKIDLIVIGTHGRKGIERILFGSVAEHVVKNSAVPVLTVNPYRGPGVEADD